MTRRHDKQRRVYGLSVSVSFALLSWTLPAPSFAQLLGSDGQVMPSLTALAAQSSDITEIPGLIALPTSKPIAFSLPTTSFITVTTNITPSPTPPAVGGPSSEASEPNRDPDDKIINLYFLLLFLGAFAILSIYLLLRRRRKDKSARLRRRGHNALALDLATWPGTYVTRGRSGWHGLGTAVGHRSIEEGLDERGEAPPPYEHPPPVSPVIEELPGHDSGRGGSDFEGTAGLTVPARALPREVGLQPPGYSEALRHPSDVSSTNPDTTRQFEWG